MKILAEQVLKPRFLYVGYYCNLAVQPVERTLRRDSSEEQFDWLLR